MTNLKVMSSSDTSFKITWDKPNKPNGVSHYIVIVANYSGEGDIKTRIQLAIDVTKENVDNLCKSFLFIYVIKLYSTIQTIQCDCVWCQY